MCSAAAHRAETAPGGVSWEVLNEAFLRLKKPKATENVCSGLADAACVARGVSLVEAEITITPPFICQYFFIFYFKPKYFLHMPITGRVDLDQAAISGCAAGLFGSQMNCDRNDSSELSDLHVLLYCHISPYYDNDTSVT